METIKHSENKVNWTSVIVYYIIACAFSWPFFWWRDMNSESWQNLHLPGFVKTWSYMWGPGFSALICFLIFKRSHLKTISFAGTSLVKSLLFYLVPILLLCIPGIQMGGMDPHLAPLVLCFIGFISILGEELGWRGFLQDALRSLPFWKRSAIIGIMWELWHFTNRMGHGALSQIIIRVSIFMCITILLSALIGKATDRSRSLMIAVTLHAWIDLLFEFSAIGTYIVFGCSVLLWIYLLMIWDQKSFIPSFQKTHAPDAENG
jgi:membrane protease YdiL (CAAX protease family)